LYREGATVHSARLARALRQAVLRSGCLLFEGSPVRRIRSDRSSAIIETACATLQAESVVLSTNVSLVGLPQIAPYLTTFSSYAAMSALNEAAIKAAGWQSDVGAADLRMFLHYFRKAGDRVLMGSGSGPIGFGAHVGAEGLRLDSEAMRRPEIGLHRLLPQFKDTAISKVWGWPIDVSSDRLPVIGSIPDQPVHYAFGFSGHGVNPTYIAGQCLASKVLRITDRWTASPFCKRKVPWLPPQPLRFLGGAAVRWGALRCEDAEDVGRKPALAARLCAAVPRVTGMAIGVR
jgi:glycine/D-amino acid oxidase-like deaminating enzyme